MEYKDYYKTMGVSKDATPEAIKTAYRRLARKYHPDISKETNAEEKFKALGEAYEVLKDPKKRAAYDQYAEHWQAYQHDPRPHEQPYTQHAHRTYQGSAHQFSDFFESLFGGGGFEPAQQAGSHYEATLNLDLEEAYTGGVKEIQLTNQQGIPQALKVKIPAGVKSGQRIRLAGQGAPGIGGGPAGDLYLTVTINKHPTFDTMGNDIYLTLPITPWEAALGATIMTPTLGGPIGLKIPPGSQGGQKLRLKHRGLPGKSLGDQYVILKITIPHPVSDKAKALFQQMAEEIPYNPRDKMGS